MSQTKSEFLEEMNKQYDDLNYRWSIERDKFEAQSQHATAEARKQFEKGRDEYRQFRKERQKKIADLEASSDKAWEQLKDGIEQASASLNDALDKVLSHFK